MDAFEKIIRATVEGQVRSFLHDHPECAAGWTGKLPPGRSRVDAVTHSLAKRISRDLVCAQTRMRLMATLVELAATASSEAALACQVEQPAPGVEVRTAPGCAADTPT